MAIEASNEGAYREGPPPVSKPKPPASNPTLRYAVALGVLVLIVGGIAWVVQYLPGRGRTPGPAKPKGNDKALLRFERPVALWDTKKVKVPNKDGSPSVDGVPFKDVEFGTKGHYDFPVKNVYGGPVEVLSFASSCDCNSMKIAVLSNDEWERVNAQQEAKPGEPLSYQAEPTWHDIVKAMGEPAKTASLVLKADEGAVIRIAWTATKTGEDAFPNPVLSFRAADDPTLYIQRLAVPVLVKPALDFHPNRVHVGVLTAGKTVTAEFDIWSATRDKLDFKMTMIGQDPLFAFDAKPLVGKELEDKRGELFNKKLAPRVLCAYRASITVHESKDGRHLDQGSFYRKPYFILDGKANPDLPLWGPEIVGRVEGDIQIGGTDDNGKILFKSFDIKQGKSKEVYLVADADLKLKTLDTHPYQPTWVKVELSRVDKQSTKTRATWLLEVTVPAGAIGARTFEEPDAVVLQIVGAKDRFVRIPLEGHISR